MGFKPWSGLKPMKAMLFEPAVLSRAKPLRGGEAALDSASPAQNTPTQEQRVESPPHKPLRRARFG
jgi:hypothetical protein